MGLEDIDNLYKEDHLHESIITFPVWSITKKELHETVIKEVTQNQDQKINPTLRDLYKDNFIKATKSIFGKPTYEDRDFTLSQQALINMERLASFKAYHATQQIKRLNINSVDFEKKAKSIINTYNRYQITEYNTIMARARTAQQWQGFKARKELYPNIQWLPSRSAEQRLEHRTFYYRIWPMESPFWDENQPGSEWGCKCDWTETDTMPTDNSELPTVDPPLGLEGNPGKTGEFITNEHPYISRLKQSTRSEIENAVEAEIKAKALSDAQKLENKNISQSINEKPIKVKITHDGLTNISEASASDTNYKNALLPYFDSVIAKSNYVKSVSDHHYFKTFILNQIMFIDIKFEKGFYYLETLLDKL